MALPADAASLDEADAAIELWEHYRRRKLDDGQRLDVAVMLATRSDGLWAAQVTGHEKPRQSGKGDSIEVVEFWGLTQRSERILHTIHDAVLLATETQSRMSSLFEHSDLRRLRSREWKGTGQQMIEMRNGGIIWYRTRTGAGGRGLDEVDRLVVDEAQHAEQQHLNSITPTQGVAANPQLNVLGTGGLDGKSAWWWSLRKQAKGDPGAFAWVGYSAQPWEVDADGRVTLGDVDPSNRDLWWSTIPGLVAGRITIDFLEREFRVLGPEGFAQEYLCVWAPPVDLGRPGPIDLVKWAELADSTSKISGEVSTAIDVSPDLKWTTIANAGTRPDGQIHVEIGRRQPGTEWIVPFCTANPQHGPFRVVGSSPAGFLLKLLEDAGVWTIDVPASEVTQATQRLIASVDDGTIHHLGSNEIAAALSNATLKASGDSQVWSRIKSSGDISALVAATVAVGGVRTDVDPIIRF